MNLSLNGLFHKIVSEYNQALLFNPALKEAIAEVQVIYFKDEDSDGTFKTFRLNYGTNDILPSEVGAVYSFVKNLNAAEKWVMFLNISPLKRWL